MLDINTKKFNTHTCSDVEITLGSKTTLVYLYWITEKMVYTNK